mmetsp:Transcript_51081/g.128195  ORF Transcript_51081/g.128195 Transcript_51081/m.128195 type:complete len:260 (+) Transcript_51081:246-1025(+)
MSLNAFRAASRLSSRAFLRTLILSCTSVRRVFESMAFHLWSSWYRSATVSTVLEGWMSSRRSASSNSSTNLSCTSFLDLVLCLRFSSAISLMNLSYMMRRWSVDTAVNRLSYMSLGNALSYGGMPVMLISLSTSLKSSTFFICSIRRRFSSSNCCSSSDSSSSELSSPSSFSGGSPPSPAIFSSPTSFSPPPSSGSFASPSPSPSPFLSASCWASPTCCCCCCISSSVGGGISPSSSLTMVRISSGHAHLLTFVSLLRK